MGPSTIIKQSGKKCGWGNWSVNQIGTEIIDRFNVLVNETIKTVADETQEIIQVAGTEVSLFLFRSTKRKRQFA